MQIPQYTQRVQKEFTPSTKATFNVPSALSDASHLGKQADIASNAVNVLGDMYQKMTDDRNLAIATKLAGYERKSVRLDNGGTLKRYYFGDTAANEVEPIKLRLGLFQKIGSHADIDIREDHAEALLDVLMKELE